MIEMDTLMFIEAIRNAYMWAYFVLTLFISMPAIAILFILITAGPFAIIRLINHRFNWKLLTYDGFISNAESFFLDILGPVFDFTWRVVYIANSHLVTRTDKQLRLPKKLKTIPRINDAYFTVNGEIVFSSPLFSKRLSYNNIKYVESYDPQNEARKAEWRDPGLYGINSVDDDGHITIFSSRRVVCKR